MELDCKEIKHAVIMARYRNEWVYVMKKHSATWEIPGGKREFNETVLDCALRELYEETGAINFKLFPVKTYLSQYKNEKKYGMIYFASIYEFTEIPQESEIGKKHLFTKAPRNLTYPEIMPYIYSEILKFLQTNYESSGSLISIDPKKVKVYI